MHGLCGAAGSAAAAVVGRAAVEQIVLARRNWLRHQHYGPAG
jgi:hypothetical protein